MNRWLSEAEAREHTGLSRNSFRRHVLPHLHPVKYTKRLVRYDRQEIDRRLAAMQGEGAPSGGEEALWLAKINEDTGARR